jgi:hypothetical protein
MLGSKWGNVKNLLSNKETTYMLKVITLTFHPLIESLIQYVSKKNKYSTSLSFKII